MGSEFFTHKTVGTQMTQTEFEGADGKAHKFATQAVGDLVYADTTEILKSLNIGTTGQVLEVSSGKPAWTNTIYNTGLILGYGSSDATINFATDNNIIFKIDNTAQIKLVDGVLQPQTDSDVDLGTTSVRFKDAYIDTITTTGNITPGGSLVSSSDFTIDSGADIVLDADGADVLFKDAGTTYGSATNNSGNLIIKSGTTTALTFTGANVAVAGDLTITGDDLFMGTNTAGMLLIADGTNFNPTAITDLSAISSIDNTDTFLAIDATDGALKKVARSVVVSGLATSSAISNVADDSDPHLGGNLDVGTNSIITDTGNRNIKLQVHGTGKVEFRGNTDSSGTNPGTIILNCEQNSHGQTIKAQAHSAGVTNTLTLPAGSDGELVSTVSTQTLTNKRLTTPKLNEDVTLTATATELNLLDDVSGLVQADFTKLAAVDATATELNIMDGNTSVGTTAVVDGDGIVTNDGGTMKQTSVETFATYFGSEITAMSNLVTTGTLNSGAISSGFGNIDIGSSTFDTTGAVSTGDLTLADDKTITLGNEGQVVLGDNTPANGKGTGLVIKGTLKTGVTAGMVVYLHSDGEYEHADNDAEGTMPAVGVALEDAGSNKKILIYGIYNDTALSLTQGKELYVSDDGAVTHTVPGAGHFLQRVGVALDSNTVLFAPSLDVIEHA